MTWLIGFISVLPAYFLLLPVAIAGTGAARDSIVVAVTSNLAYQDPHVSSLQVDSNYSMHVFEGLVSLSENYTAQLQLAESVDISPDGREYVFKLRSGVRFHDGRVMTSADVLSSFGRYARVSPNRALLSGVVSMSAPAADTFRIVFSTPHPLFLERMCSPRYLLAILPAADGQTEANANSGIGTGPYRIVQRVADDFIRLERFTGYMPDERYDGPSGYGGKRTANLHSITFRVIPEALSRIAALQAGDVQLIDNVPAQSVPRLGLDRRVRLVDVMPFSKYVTILNASRPPTDNPLIRRAIQAAINDAELMTIATENFYQPSGSFLFETSPFYFEPAGGFRPQSARVNEARKLLEEAGYAGQRITIMTTADYPSMKNGMIVLLQQLRAAGMNVELRLVDWQSNVAHRTSGTGGWNITTTGYGSLAFEGPQAYEHVFAQMAHIPHDEVLESGFERFVRSVDLGARKRAWRDIETRMAEQAYILVNGDRGMLLAASAGLKNVRPYYSIRLWDTWFEY